MKILAIVPSYNDGSREPSKFICELSNPEMAVLAKGAFSPGFRGDFQNVKEIEICDKFSHAMEVLYACQNAIKIPGQSPSAWR